MRNATVRAIWACADLLSVVQGGLIMLASYVVGEEAPTAAASDDLDLSTRDYPRMWRW
jgi:hypothetical protein